MSSAAVVTGAGRGIGREVARQLAERGFTVVACDRDGDAVRDAVARLAVEGFSVAADITADEAVSRLGQQLGRFDGGVQTLVNCAGVVRDGWGASVLDAPIDVFRATWEVNALGTLRVTRAVLPHLLRSSRRPRIVNVSSGMGQLVEMGGMAPAYRTSKTIVNALTRILAAELDERAFVASVCPGWVRTELGGDQAPRSVEQGADTIVWLAADDGVAELPTGCFWRDRTQIPW